MYGTYRKLRFRRMLATGAASLLFAAPTLAEADSAGMMADTDRAGQIAPAPGSDESHTMQLVGKARLKVLLWSVYDSRLYTPTGRYDDGDRPLRLEIQYLRDIPARDLVDRTLVEWQAMGRNHPRQQQWLAALEAMWPDIAATDVLTLDLNTEGAAMFRHNGRSLGTIEDPAFGQEFVDIWLSRDCTRPELRLALIGRDEG